MKHQFCVFIVTPMILLTGCASTSNMPLIFGQSQTLGITIGGSANDQGAEFTLGYKDKNFAVVPVTVKQNSGDSTQIRSQATPGHEDALSVLGQFEVNSSTNSANVGLGKFFATGMAAKKLADGFCAKLGGAAAEQDEPPKQDEETKK